MCYRVPDSRYNGGLFRRKESRVTAALASYARMRAHRLIQILSSASLVSRRSVFTFLTGRRGGGGGGRLTQRWPCDVTGRAVAALHGLVACTGWLEATQEGQPPPGPTVRDPAGRSRRPGPVTSHCGTPRAGRACSRLSKRRRVAEQSRDLTRRHRAAPRGADLHRAVLNGAGRGGGSGRGSVRHAARGGKLSAESPQTRGGKLKGRREPRGRPLSRRRECKTVGSKGKGVVLPRLPAPPPASLISCIAAPTGSTARR